MYNFKNKDISTCIFYMIMNLAYNTSVVRLYFYNSHNRLLKFTNLVKVVHRFIFAIFFYFIVIVLYNTIQNVDFRVETC